MKILLDTHVLLWWLRDDPRLGQESRGLIAEPGNEVLVSVASFWELSIKTRIGKLDAPGSAIMRHVAGEPFRVVCIEPHHLELLEVFAWRADHKDPFDHLILAQAIAEEARLLTGDRTLRAYDVPAVRDGWSCSRST